VNRPSPRRRRPAILPGLTALFACVAFAASLATAPACLAYGDYVHGDVPVDACHLCHIDSHTNWPVASEVCLSCHTGYEVPDAPVTCWTCHTPGQDMSVARADAACTADCHLTDGTTSRHSAHDGGGPACTTCHPVSPSAVDAGDDPHHVLHLPACSVSGFTPASGAPGTVVTVDGAGFSRVTAVTFGGVRASTFTVLSATRLTAVVPYDAATGPVAVLNAAGAATSTADFVVPGRVTAAVTLAVSPASVPHGGRVTVRGTVVPAALAGARVSVSFQMRTATRWTTAATVTAVSSAGGVFGRAWRPPGAGLYRVRATLAATAEHTAARSPWAAFRVR